MVIFFLFHLILISALAFRPVCMLRDGGIEAVGGFILLAFDLLIARHSGRFALRIQRASGIPHGLCGFGMIAAALICCAAFNLFSLCLCQYLWKSWV